MTGPLAYALAAVCAVAAVAERRIIRYVRPPLASYQTEAFFNTARIGCVEASTKSGKTHGMLAWEIEQAALLGGPGKNFWWVAPVYAQAEIAYRRAEQAIPPVFRKSKETNLTHRLINGATIWFKSGEKPNNLYGEDVYAAAIDEASRLREESWWAVRSTLTKTRGPIRIVGNVKGRRNWAYKLARRAEAGEPGYAHKKIRAADAVKAGIISADEVEQARRDLPAAIFQELFDAEPADDAGNPFGLDAIRACLAPVSLGTPVAWGVDLAKYQDWTVLIGLDAAGYVCRFDRFQGPWQLQLARIRKAVGSVLAYVDSTGVGDPIVEALQEGGRANYVSYKFTSGTKQQLMEGLAVAIQQQLVHYPRGVIQNELEAFEYEYHRTGVRYQAPAGVHDDTVCALALAVMAKGRGGSLPRWVPIA